jgi:hypothetical protein
MPCSNARRSLHGWLVILAAPAGNLDRPITAASDRSFPSQTIGDAVEQAGTVGIAAAGRIEI